MFKMEVLPMSYRTMLTIAFNVALLLAVCGGAIHAQSTPQATRPNVLLVLSDDHSVPHVGAYGNPDIKTPNLDAFAKDGMRFDRYYVGTPQCVPSRATML